MTRQTVSLTLEGTVIHRHSWTAWLPNWQIVLGVSLIGLFLYLALAAPYLTTPTNPDPILGNYRKIGQPTDLAPLPPSPALPWGGVPDGKATGQFDVWYSFAWGTRTALLFGFGVVLVSASLGIIIGAISAYWGGWLDRLLMGLTDGFLTIPLIAGVVFFRELVYLGLQSTGVRIFFNGTLDFPGPITAYQSFLLRVDPVFLSFMILAWMPYARLMNSAITVARQAEYAQAVYALGAGHMRILFKHLVPNTIAPALVLAARDVAYAVLIQASLSFIGLDTHSEWGRLLSLGRNWIIGPGGNPLQYWWVFVPVSAGLILFGIAWNLFGDGLNDRLNQVNS